MKDRNNRMILLRNKRVLLVRRPDGLPVAKDFELDEELVEISRNRRKPAILLETLFVSIDPAMRGWMSSAKSYLPPIPLGSVVRASTISRVKAIFGNDRSEVNRLNELYPIGSVVKSEIVGVQSYCLLENCSLSKAKKLLKRVDNRYLPENNNNNNNTRRQLQDEHQLSVASYLGVLGTTGLTAYFGLLHVGKPKASDVVLVSGAAGATGSIVAQIAKNVIGCRKVIGTAGTDAKCDWLLREGIVDVAINYKSREKSLSKAIREAHNNNNGVDLVFDNVGSNFLEAALSNLAMGARVVLCGAISQYNQNAEPKGPKNYMNLLVRRATMKGFVVLDYRKDFPRATNDLIQWISQKKIRSHKEDMRYKGMEGFYPALMSLFRGTNRGKVVLDVRQQESSSSADASKIVLPASKL